MSKDIWSLLRRRYSENEYALLAEVRDKAGHYASNSADYLAINLYPSRGLAINGIELKSHRGDWLNELKKPEKAENIFKYCDYFWLLTADDAVAKMEEIPMAWGWLSIKGERIRVKKDAPKLTPVPISKHFFCAVVKRASSKKNWVRYDEIEERINLARESGKDEKRHLVGQLEKELKELRDAVTAFQEASGINLQHYMRWETSPAKMGEAVKLINAGGAEPIKKQLLELETTAKIVLERISDGLKALK